jgi:S1-C subfamily serine protease
VVGNMAVPADLLADVLDEMLRYGRSRAADRPWLGLYAADGRSGIVVTGVAAKGPAAAAGLAEGDMVVGIEGEAVAEVAELWQRLWATGSPGVRVRLTILRNGEPRQIELQSVDRHAFLKQPRLH